MPTCVFCDIVAGLAEASIIYRDALCTAFLTIQPVTAGHTLVVPNSHAARLSEIPENESARMFRVAQWLADGFSAAGLRCEGVNLVLCDGAAAGQTVFHSHLHVNPRYAGDGFGWVLPESYGSPPSRQELERIAKELAPAVAACSSRVSRRTDEHAVGGS